MPRGILVACVTMHVCMPPWPRSTPQTSEARGQGPGANCLEGPAATSSMWTDSYGLRICTYIGIASAPAAPPPLPATSLKSSQAELSQAESSRVKPSQAESSRVKSSRVESSRAKSNRVEPSRVESSRVESSRRAPPFLLRMRDVGVSDA